MAVTRLFKVGADPEFGFVDTDGELYGACDLIKDDCGGRFGLDGCNEIAELRPEPSENPSVVVKNIYRAMADGVRRNRETLSYSWEAGSILFGDGEYPIGGHIHLGIKYRGIDYADLALDLDALLTQVVRLLEEPDKLKKRSCDYGMYSDMRANHHGAEYRTLGSWITSPRIAEGVLCLAQAITYEKLSFKNRKIKLLSDRLRPDKEDEFALDIKDMRKKFRHLRVIIRKLKLYKKYKQPIDFLLKLIEKKKTWYPGTDMKVAWGISAATSGLLPLHTLPKVKFNDIWIRARKG